MLNDEMKPGAARQHIVQRRCRARRTAQGAGTPPDSEGSPAAPGCDQCAGRGSGRPLGGGTSFDAVSELAQHIPVTIVSNAIGLPKKGRERMLVWAESLFNCIGPMNDRTVDSVPILNEMMEYATNEAVREN